MSGYGADTGRFVSDSEPRARARTGKEGKGKEGKGSLWSSSSSSSPELTREPRRRSDSSQPRQAGDG